MLDDSEDKKVEDEIHGLNTKAVEALRSVLSDAESDDVRRKAAVDILQFSQVGKSKGRAPQVTEAQLEFLGRVIVEAESVRESLALSKGSLAGTTTVSTD